MNRSLSLSLALTLSSFVVACGPPTSFEPNVDDLRTLASLTDEEAASYCAAAADYRRAVVSDDEAQATICTVVAAAFSPDPSTCGLSRTSCLEADGELTFDCIADGAERASCDVTIAEVNRCIADNVEVLARMGMEVDCSIAGDPAAIATLSSSTPPSCMEILERCPGLSE